MPCTIPIRISEEIRLKLIERKRYRRESYDEIIEELLKKAESEEIEDG